MRARDNESHEHLVTQKGSHWDGTGCHPSLNQSNNTGGIAASNQEIFSQRGAGLVMSSGQANAEITDGDSPSLNCNRDGAPIAFTGHSDPGVLCPYCEQTHDAEFNRDKDYLKCPACGKRTYESICVHGTQDPCISKDTAFSLGRNTGRENAIAFERRFVRTTGGQPMEGVNGCLRADLNGGDGAPCVAFAPAQVGPTMGSSGPPYSRSGNERVESEALAISSMQVRRLTPVECERLQGFPDNWTQIPWNGKPAEECPDGHRYKALRNSMSVNVMEWIGERIERANHE